MNQTNVTPERAFRSAVGLCDSQAAFARLIGKSPARVSQMLSDLKSICPAESVLTIERELGISRHVLRPDLYPIEDDNP
jgi:DNA-binding transcriptional regulator YdaS (Cro superfamily)